MEEIASTLAQWRVEGQRLIPEHWKEFRRLVAVTEDLARGKHFSAAAAYGELAALYAISRHCGIFVSPALERVLIGIGKLAITPSKPSNGRRLHYPPRHVLHVSTRVMPVGGHSRMIWRWIQQDEGRTHSLALTRQTSAVPAMLKAAVAQSGGHIWRVNRAVGGLVAWARELREIAANVDVVVLHSFNDDVVPPIAFACQDQRPPVILLDHADHIFWLGAGISDVVVSLRESGMRLAQHRRGIAPERSLLLPTVLGPIERRFTRKEAKRRIGLPEDSVLLLSIARALKYGMVGPGSYADAHVPILERHKNAWLMVIGPQDRPDWSSAVRRTQGRIVQLGELEDTARYYEAADIYVDSFPFVSTTSLLEAGGYGTPLLSIFPYSEASGTLGADMPGLDGNLIRCRDLDEYEKALSRLIENEGDRLERGEATREKILKLHTGVEWQIRLEKIYRQACQLASSPGETTAAEEIFLGEPDLYIPQIHGHAEHSESAERDVDEMIESLIRIMPPEERVRQWIRLARAAGGFRNANRIASLKYLVPEWLIGRVKSDPWRGVGAAP